jgi:hypothetical protein
MLSKTSVLHAVEQLPDQFTVDRLIDELIFVSKVEQGLKESKEGRVVSMETARERLAKWLS